ncbi:hypothetical protein M0R04_15175 [Candidatus Dojkabacteria bacterium]|nr:hypothetical protein [Candidatus Dojkabacteria bacterium]
MKRPVYSELHSIIKKLSFFCNWWVGGVWEEIRRFIVKWVYLRWLNIPYKPPFNCGNNICDFCYWYWFEEEWCFYHKEYYFPVHTCNNFRCNHCTESKRKV